MGKLGCAALGLTLGGCSLIYNPSNLPSAPGEAGVTADAEVILDADPTHLALTAAFPPALDEGLGIDGSRAGVLVVTGTQIIPGAQISVARTGGGATTAMVDNTLAVVAADGLMIAVPIKIGIDPALGPSATKASYTLDVTVTQAGTITKTLPAAVQVVGYDELTAAAAPPGAHTYSRVMLTGAFTATASTEPLVIRSTSSISITGAIAADATGTSGGPGGGTGGAGGTTAGQGGDGTGPGKGLHNSGGGGFGTAGGAGMMAGTAGPVAGDPGMKSLVTNRGSGGAGGAGGVGTGGAGGGGGGTVELSARGNLMVAGVTADGAKGVAGNNGVGTTDGGSGSGGGVLLRTGGTLAATGMVSVKGAAAAPKGAIGGDGRVRLDAPDVAASVTASVAVYRGPMFAADTPLMVRTKSPTIAITCQANASFTYYILDEDGSLIEPLTSPLTCGPQGKESIDFEAKGSPLSRGVNHVCLLVEGATRIDGLPEDRNCIDVAFLYQP